MQSNPMLFDVPETIKKPRWDEMVTSLSYDEKEIIRNIMLLHNGGKAFDVDPTFSVGRFWEGLPKPKRSAHRDGWDFPARKAFIRPQVSWSLGVVLAETAKMLAGGRGYFPAVL